MTTRYIFFGVFTVLLILLTVNSAMAANPVPDSCWSGDSDFTDDIGSNDLTTFGSPAINTTQKKVGSGSMEFIASSSQYAYDTSLDNPSVNLGDGNFSIGYWAYDRTLPAQGFHVLQGSSSNYEQFGIEARPSEDFISQFSLAGSGWAGTLLTNVIPTVGTWYHVIDTFDDTSNNLTTYINGINIWSDSISSINVVSNRLVLAKHYNNAAYGDVLLDELKIWDGTVLTLTEVQEDYNSGNGQPCVASTPAANSTNATERLQQDSEVLQNGTVTVNSVSYIPIFSSSVTLGDTGNVYGFASVPIIPTASNTATCRITKDGAELNNSEASRSLTAGQAGNLILSSFAENLTAGPYDFGVECYRTGGGAYDVQNTSLSLTILTSSDGEVLEYEEYNISGSVSGLISSETFTTSENATNVNLTRALVLEMTAAFDYSATGNITITPELAGTNCTPINRYGSSGSTGSIVTSCHVEGLTNSTTYDFKLYGAGSGTILAKTHLKEFILHAGEINTTSMTGTTITNSNQSLINTTITVAAGHSTPNLIGQSGVNMVSTNGTQTSSFYFTDGTTSSGIVSRTVAEGQAGVLGLEKSFSSASGTETLQLFGGCLGCSLVGGDILAFISGDVAASPNSFIVQANNIYSGTALSEFNINLSDGRSFSTTTGSIEVPATGQALSITALEDSSAAIPYFSNTTLNHNSTYDITLNVTPYTVINATFGGVKVNNFTFNGTTTTTGAVYARLFSSTTEFNITDATAADGTNLSDQAANITASPYLQNYTYIMLTANVFNFSILDELTEALITENMTIELITGATAGTYTTTNGTLYLELLTPSDYTIRYYSTEGSNYTQRDYIQTLVDRQRYDISLYSLLNAEATDMVVTIKDTSGDPVENAIVKLLRYYTSCACYNVVEMATTSAAGESYFVVDAYDGHYKFAVEYAGVTEFLSSSPENFIPSGGIVSRSITINLGSAYFQSFRALTDVARTLTYNNDTKGLSFTWNDPSGIVTQGCLHAEYLDGVHYTAVTPVCQEASTGSVVMTLNNSVSSYKYYAELETSTTYSEYVVFSGVIDKIRETLLQGNIGLGAFLGAGVLMVLALMFSFSAIAVMIITGIGVIGMSVLGLASFTTVFITGLATLIIGIAAYLMRS